MQDIVLTTRKKIAFTVIMILLMLLLLEMLARGFFYLRANPELMGKVNITPSWMLDPYEIADTKQSSHWLLKPGYEKTAGELLEVKKKDGRVLAVENIERLFDELKVKKSDLYIHVNSKGFRGPELDPSHSGIRVLTIGDSTTFGAYGPYTYPRVLERKLIETGLDVEVVNAGVEGYAPRNILLNMDRYKAVQPDIVTIYIGWNAIYGVTDMFLGMERYLYSLRFIEKLWYRLQLLFSTPQALALKEYNQEKNYNPNDQSIHVLDDYDMKFLQDIEKIVDEFLAFGSQVVIVTLPGLFNTYEQPSELAMKVGHLPPFTDNPFFLARMTEIYNERLRALARQRDLQLIDLDQWSVSALKPRDQFFFDSVHLYEEGQYLIGDYMASQLESTVREAARQ